MTPAKQAVRQRAKRGQGDRLRADIVAAAERLLAETGDPDKVSVRALARAAGCTPPAIYLHWADKDELILEVCNGRFKEFDEWIQRASAEARDPLDALRLAGRAYIRFGLENPEAYRVLMITKHEGALDAPGHEQGSLAFHHLVESVQRCVDAGSLPGVDAVRASLSLWAATHGLTSLLLTFPNFGWGETDALVDFFLDVQIEGLLST